SAWTRSPTCSRSPSTSARSSAPAHRASSGTPSSVRRSSAKPGGVRSSTASCTCSATTTGPRWSAARSNGATDPPPRADAAREFQLRGRRDHPRRPHAAEHADSPRGGGGRAGGGDLDRRLQAGADRAAARDRVRLHRRDDQLGARAGDRCRHDLVRSPGQAREGRRRGRGADRDRERDRERLPGLLPRARRPQPAPAQPPPRCARHAGRVPAVHVTDELFERAVAVAERAYAPYSNYLVGAAVLARDGRVFEGVNVENASYPLGICAERAALSRAVVEGGCRPGDLEAMAITVSPCGGCRQWLYEFRLDRVTFRNREGEIVSYTPAELLPETWDLT